MEELKVRLFKMIKEEEVKKELWYGFWLDDKNSGISKKKSDVYSRYRIYCHSTNKLKELYYTLIKDKPETSFDEIILHVFEGCDE